LAVLLQRGMAAWIGAWHALPAAPAPIAPPPRAADDQQLVGVLATMALALVRAG
jgi:hypothetical protein